MGRRTSGAQAPTPSPEAPSRAGSRRLQIAFERRLRLIQPTARELHAAQRAARLVRRTLSRRLGTGILRIVNFGSHAKRTSIRERSDVDLLFVVSPDLAERADEPSDSMLLLRLFRRALARRFPSTRIRRDGQAVSLRFARTGVNLDIVPAVPDGRHQSTNMYRIPDGQGGWLRVAPTAEHARFQRANRASQGKMGRTLQLLKFWRVCRSRPIPLRSYSVELALTSARVANGARSYGQILLRSFRLLCQREGRSLKDPARRVDLTPMLHRQVRAAGVQRLLCRHRDLAHRAERLARAGREDEALACWQKIFNGRFLAPARPGRRVRSRR